MNDLIAFSEKFKRLRDLLILYCGWSFRRGYIIILNLWTIYIYLGTGLYISLLCISEEDLFESGKLFLSSWF